MYVIGYIPGVWDLLHVGHVTILRRARSLCDRLVVGVPTDEVVLEDKGRLPAIPLADRVMMLEALRCVDLALPYHHLEFLSHLSTLKPDILFVGSTWGNEKRHLDALAWCHAQGCQVIMLPYTDGVSTTQIKERILCGK